MNLWAEAIESHFKDSSDLDILDLGSGGGHHLYHLVNHLGGHNSGMAVDLSATMLGRVAGLVPSFSTQRGDMTNQSFPDQYDLVTVHDSFCYLTQTEQLVSLFGNIAKHLKPQGMALVKLEAVSDSFDGPYRYLTSFADDEREVTVTHYEWDPDDSDHSLEVVYLFLVEEGGRLTTREERHCLGLFSKAEILACVPSDLKAEYMELPQWDEDRENLVLVLRGQIARCDVGK